jgi:predicted GH43/DUF377 family glycosyl hydrolase
MRLKRAGRVALLAIVAGVLQLSVGAATDDNAPVPLHAAPAPKGVDDSVEAAGVPSWGLGPFVRCPENPLIVPRSDTTFFCPLLKQNVAWEAKNIVGAAAAVKDGKVYWLYRAEPINMHNSRDGLGISEDGIHFQCQPTPVLYPDEDAFKQYEWPGGTEDGRIVQREDGLFIYLYCAYDGRTPRQSVATSRDLIHWSKQGPAFAKAYDGKYLNRIAKGGSVISRYFDDGRVVAEKINGKYWMYLIGYNVAYSDDCINWTPVIDSDGRLTRVLPPRAGGGKFDCGLIEPGPPPIVTPKGILVIYHGGENDPKRGDPNLPKRDYSGGQALFDLNDPTKMIARCDNYFLTPRMPYELNSSVGAPVCFMEGLVRFKGKWLLYYEAGDHVGAMASCDQSGFEPPAAK